MPEQHTAQRDQSVGEQVDAVLQSRMDHIAHKLLVLSGKGGVGKSTIAVNLAVGLAWRGKKVGLLDVDVHGPSIPQLLGLQGRALAGTDQEFLPVELRENLSVVSIGFMLRSRRDAVIWRGPLKYQLIRRFLRDVRWGNLDYLVVDSPPGTGDEPLTVAQLAGREAGAILVTTPQDVAISDVRRCGSFCQAVSLRVVGIVENMSGLVCPRCGWEIEVFKTGGGEALAREMNVPFLGRIPIDPQIVYSGDTGTLQAEHGTPSASTRAFQAVVERILAGNQNRS